MNTDSYTKMVEDGRDITSVLESAPENKRILVSAIAWAYLNGLNTGETLAEAKYAAMQTRPGA